MITNPEDGHYHPSTVTNHCHVIDPGNYHECKKMKQMGEIVQPVLIMYINVLLLLSIWTQPFRSCLNGCLSNKTAQDSQTQMSLGSELQLEQTCYDDLSLLLFVTESRRNCKWQNCVCAVPRAVFSDSDGELPPCNYGHGWPAMTAHLLTSQLESGAPCPTEMSCTCTQIKNCMQPKRDLNKWRSHVFLCHSLTLRHTHSPLADS